MWKTKKKINLGSADDHKYLCHKCAPTEVSAKKLFTDQDEFKLRAKRLARGLPIW